MILGFDPIKFRPEMLIHTIFPVPPVQIRPTVRNDGEKSYTMVDDLTIKLTDIIKANNRLLKHKETGNFNNTSKYLSEYSIYLQYLQYHIATYYDNDTILIPKSIPKSGGIKQDKECGVLCRGHAKYADGGVLPPSWNT